MHLARRDRASSTGMAQGEVRAQATPVPLRGASPPLPSHKDTKGRTEKTTGATCVGRVKASTLATLERSIQKGQPPREGVRLASAVSLDRGGSCPQALLLQGCPSARDSSSASGPSWLVHKLSYCQSSQKKLPRQLRSQIRAVQNSCTLAFSGSPGAWGVYFGKPLFFQDSSNLGG